ncbi:hypothetical protein [Micromonospora craterilacus]|uniref:hypothetical protein n=1 Tax=Micromonospora craterilacus TaxID=1655439 RepID=UPI001F315681|nr:hypothetical protein [Micromonospora craterilacus]
MTTDQSASGGPQPTSRHPRAAGDPAPEGTETGDAGPDTSNREPGTAGSAVPRTTAPGGTATASSADRTARGGPGADATTTGEADTTGEPGADATTTGKPGANGTATGKTSASGSTTDGASANGTAAGEAGASGTTTGAAGTSGTLIDRPGAGGAAEASGRAGTDRSNGERPKAGKDEADLDKADKEQDGDGDAKDRAGAQADGGSNGGKPDRWAAFGPAPEPVPTWYGRLARWLGRFLIHEWTLAALGSLALAVLMTWPTLQYARHTLPQDYWDPSLQAWQMAWSGHVLLTDPAQLWHANAFYPERWSFAFSDTLLGYAPAGMIGTGPEAALVRYNIMFVLAHALATFGAYVLARQLGAGRIGSAVAGVSYTYAPWLLAQAGHLHVISNGGIPLALAMLARGHGWSLRHGYRPERRHEGWVYAGWLVAAWQLSLGFGIGLPFAYFLAGAVVVAAVIWYAKRIFWRLKRPFGQRLFVADLIGGLIFAGVGVLMAIPYFTVTQLHPNAERTIGDIAVFSPPASGFVTAPAESRVWGGLHEGARAILPWHPEMTLLPGFALYALAAGGLFFSIWTVRQRLLLLAGVLVAMTLSMGTKLFGGDFTYVPLFEYLPGWSGIRTPGRLMLWTTLLLGLLAAGAVSAFAQRVREISAERIPSWPSPWLRLATLVPLMLVIAEGTNTTPHPMVPPQPAAMRTVDGPLLVLPSGQSHDQPVMLWSTTRFQDIVNGGSGFTPRQLDDVRRVTMTFPDQTSVDYLRTLGVRNVVVMRDQIIGTPWEISVDAPLDGLGITREESGSAVVFRL